MCDVCLERTAKVLLQLFNAVSGSQTITDMHNVLQVLAPSQREGVELDTAALAAVFQELGPRRTGDVIRTAGHMTAVIDDINGAGVAVMAKMAQAGDASAIQWMEDYGDRVVHRAQEEGQATDMPQGMKEFIDGLGGGISIVVLGSRKEEGAGKATPNLH